MPITFVYDPSVPSYPPPAPDLESAPRFLYEWLNGVCVRFIAANDSARALLGDQGSAAMDPLSLGAMTLYSRASLLGAVISLPDWEDEAEPIAAFRDELRRRRAIAGA